MQSWQCLLRFKGTAPLLALLVTTFLVVNCNGPAITLVVKGGLTHPEMPLQEVDVQLTVWTGINQNLQAHTIYQACLLALHGLIYPIAGVKRILATVPGIDVVDPDTGWATVVSAFNVMGF
jgi:hypothetical protein